MKKKNGLRWVSGANTSEKVYITRVLNFGTWKEWQTLKKRVSKKKIIQVAKDPLPGQWTAHGKAFAEALFNIRLPSSVLISYDA